MKTANGRLNHILNLKWFRLTVLLLASLFFLSIFGCQKPLPEKPSSKPSGPVVNTPEAARKASFKFIVFGDNRPEKSTDPQPKAFTELVTRMAKEKPGLILSTGDNVTGRTNDENLYRRQYQEFLSIVDPLNVPFYSAAGNHDVYNDLGQKLFQEMIAKDLYFSFNYQAAHFIILDTDMIGEQGLVGDEQYRWLQYDLKLNQKAAYIFIFMHRPVYSVINPELSLLKHLSFVNEKNQDRLRELFENEKVDIVFAGHEHFFNQQEHNGVKYVIAGCAGSAPYADAAHGGFPHYVLVEVNGETIKLTVVKSTGERLKPEEIPAQEF